jgi:predicted TIM-barrel fold metal-dependent hydrolase
MSAGRIRAPRAADSGAAAFPHDRARAAFRPPAGSVDTHVHVFDPARFPYSADAPYRPVPAECGTAADLASVLDAEGVARVVVVNPTSGYGNDNRCLLAALEELGPRARGIARVPPATTARSLAALRKAGVVGVRVDLVADGSEVLETRDFRRFLARLADATMLLQLQCEGDQFAAVAPLLAQVPLRCVVDHLGRPDPARGLDAPGFRALLDGADSGRLAVKLSGPMRCSALPPPHADTDPYVAALLRAFGPRALVWGSDWPFLRSPRRVDYAPTLALLARQVPRAADRRAILVSTPARWFGF